MKGMEFWLLWVSFWKGYRLQHSWSKYFMPVDCIKLLFIHILKFHAFDLHGIFWVCRDLWDSLFALRKFDHLCRWVWNEITRRCTAPTTFPPGNNQWCQNRGKEIKLFKANAHPEPCCKMAISIALGIAWHFLGQHKSAWPKRYDLQAWTQYDTPF